jgi:Domain of unknown function (DUF3883)
MIPQGSQDVFDEAMGQLKQFGTETSIRGRFVAIYLGLRLMGPKMRKLGDASGTSALELQNFLDEMFTKLNRTGPLTVLTAPFGGGGAGGGYSTRTGIVAPGNRTPTNTWRNNFGIQKGVGCPASVEEISKILGNPGVRSSCAHYTAGDSGGHCELRGTDYRNEVHSVWLRIADDQGYQVVDLDLPQVYLDYLKPKQQKIPIWPLIAMLYIGAPEAVYPVRQTIGIPDFAEDFNYSITTVSDIFDCESTSPMNAAVLASAGDSASPQLIGRIGPAPGPPLPTQAAMPLPSPIAASFANSGLLAELNVAADLQSVGWAVGYRGSQRGFGYDLEATKGERTIFVEVKSSFSEVVPLLTESEWQAANKFGAQFVLATVDFLGSGGQVIRYVVDPAIRATATVLEAVSYRFSRAALGPLGVASPSL